MSIFGRRNADPDAEAIKPPPPQQPIGFQTVLGAETTLDGTLRSKGNLRLDGEFSGKLNITGNVLVGETAIIKADIEARNISIAGAVHGNVTGNKVQLLRTGRVWGDIHANTLTTEEGAFLEGQIIVKGLSSNPPKENVTVKEPDIDETPDTINTQAEEASVTEPEAVVENATPDDDATDTSDGEDTSDD